MSGTASRTKRPPPRAQMVGVSGRVINLADPDPTTITIEDVAHALSMQCRFAGNVSRFWSVADHALLCSDLICEAGRAELALAALHHAVPDGAALAESRTAGAAS
jgi:5'-nucleotidase